MSFYESDPRRAAAKAEGVALLRQGVAVREASAIVGLPRSTLHDALQALNAGAATDAHLRAADQAQMALTYQLAAEAQQHALDRLRAGALEDKDAIQAANIALKSISAYRRWQKPEPDAADTSASTRILDRLEHALASGAALQLTVTAPKPDHAALDVEPIE